MKVKTNTLIGQALNWAVCTAEGNTPVINPFRFGGRSYGCFESELGYAIKNYSTDWAQGGPIIEREWGTILNRLFLKNSRHGDIWHEYMLGSQPVLVVFLREYVASKLGDEVEIPEELL